MKIMKNEFVDPVLCFITYILFYIVICSISSINSSDDARLKKILIWHAVFFQYKLYWKFFFAPIVRKVGMVFVRCVCSSLSPSIIRSYERSHPSCSPSIDRTNRMFHTLSSDRSYGRSHVPHALVRAIACSSRSQSIDRTRAIQ